MRLLLLGFLLLFRSFIVSAQVDFRNGYVIMDNGDSIPGEVLYGHFSQKDTYCKIRLKSGETVTYPPAQIKAYGYILDKRFESIVLPVDSVSNTRVFAEVLVKGYMSLLKYNSILYVESHDGKIHSLPRPSYKQVETSQGKRMFEQVPHIGILNWLLSDCALNANKVGYDENAISRLVQSYNRCHGQSGISYKELKKASLLTLQAFGGIQSSQLKRFSASDKKSVDRTVAPALGISLDLSSPRIFDRIFFSAEGIFSKQSFQYNENIDAGNKITLHYDYTVDQTTIKMPLGVRYNLTNDNRTFYVKAGGVLGLVSKLHVDKILEVETPYDVTTYSSSEEIKSTQTGLFGSAGYTQVMTGKLKVFVELRYENMRPPQNDGAGFSYGNAGFYAIAGIRF